LAQKACRDGFTILHKRAAELLRDLAVAHVDGSFGRLLARLSRIDVLVSIARSKPTTFQVVIL
jgi:DNA replication protein DnaC